MSLFRISLQAREQKLRANTTECNYLLHERASLHFAPIFGFSIFTLTPPMNEYQHIPVCLVFWLVFHPGRSRSDIRTFKSETGLLQLQFFYKCYNRKNKTHKKSLFFSTQKKKRRLLRYKVKSARYLKSASVIFCTEEDLTEVFGQSV